MEPVMLVHGGGDDIPVDFEPLKIAGVKKSVKIGYEILKNGGSALDAVECAVKSMEEDEIFNCGYGSVLNWDEEIEMDASVMVGSDLSSGGVSAIRDVAHPISVARLVMERTPHVLLVGDGAIRFAVDQDVPILEEGSLVTEYNKLLLTDFRVNEQQTMRTSSCGGTVGAVALDSEGHLVAATSTGGLVGKMAGRSSDSSKIGDGVYADDWIAGVSCTGHGESISKVCLSHTIVKQMELGKSAQTAAQEAVDNMFDRLQRTAGCIVLSKLGEVGVYFNTTRMPWAYQKLDKIHYGIEPSQDLMEDAQDYVNF